MIKSTYLISLLFWINFIFVSCKNETRTIHSDHYQAPILSLTEEELYDKVLGMLVGSAIGDAMGAPTEMWSRESIYSEYGFVTDLFPMIREVSAEGIWKANLPAGGTTDDTRWKVLTVNYLLRDNPNFLHSEKFARYILDEFNGYLEDLNKIDSLDAEAYGNGMLKVDWLKEWAKVSKPYIEKDLYGFEKKLSTFYGGEMVCAGLLYSPVIGAFFPEDPEKAYLEAHKLAMYDIGYAKDISALTAAMTSAAMTKSGQTDELLDVLRNIDPEDYYGSRLVGRTSYHILQTALKLVHDFRAELKDTISNNNVSLEKRMMDWDESNLNPLFLKLDKHLQDMPFHAGEIYLQLLTAMIVADFDFEKTLSFLVNYGRDNDTTAAIAGGILGAFYGFDKLPDSMKRQVLTVNKNELNIDLEKAALDFQQKIMSRYL
jgi:hypothetical protein